MSGSDLERVKRGIQLQGGIGLGQPGSSSDSPKPPSGLTDITGLPGSLQNSATATGTLLAGNLASLPGGSQIMSTLGGLPGVDLVTNIASQTQDTLGNVQSTLGSLG